MKSFILTQLAAVDIMIAQLRAQAAQYDMLAIWEKELWDMVNYAVETAKDKMLALPEDLPLADFCPEFYEALIQPAVDLLESLLSVTSLFRNRYKNLLSYMDELDALIAYWEQVKADLLTLLDLIDGCPPCEEEFEEGFGIP